MFAKDCDGFQKVMEVKAETMTLEGEELRRSSRFKGFRATRLQSLISAS
jgi:hypothetical protein